MNIKQYIQSKPELAVLNYRTVYKTILTLIGDGILSMSDFSSKPTSVIEDFEKGLKG